MKIKDIMTTNVTTVSPNSSVLEAAQMMQNYNIGSIPVCDNDRLVGIITDRDIVVRSVSRNISPNSTSVKDIMTSEVNYATPDMDVTDVTDMMASNQVRRIPVVEQNQLIGIVSLKDVAVNRKTNMEASDALTEISK